MRLIERKNLGAMNHTEGPFVLYQNFGGYAWVDDGATPEYPDRTVLLEKTDGQLWPCRYTGGRYVNVNNGLIARDPKRWFYIRFEPEVWDPNGVWTLPDGTRPPDPPTSTDPPEVPKALQDIVNAIKKNWPWQLVLDAGDLSPYDEPDQGAPL